MAITVKDANNNDQTIETLPSVSRKAAASSLPMTLSTEDKAVIDAQAASLVSILAKITADPATQTTLAAILAKIIAAPATEAKQDTANTSLASILAKIIAAPSTEAKQDTANTALAAIQVATEATQAAAESTDPVTVNVGQSEYETVAASQTDQMLGASGAAGDYLAGLLVIPATTSPGAVSIEDGSTNIPVFVGGTVGSVIPFWVQLGVTSVSGGWEVTTGTNVSVLAVGSFT